MCCLYWCCLIDGCLICTSSPCTGINAAAAAALLCPASLLQAYHARNSLPAPQAILDIGCSTGISTRWYQRAFPAADFTGLDLSPYFLAVAELEER